MATLKLGLLGAGIGRSKMPKLQHHLGKLANIDIDYVLIDGHDRAGFDPNAQIQKAVFDGFHGLNVTHPFKQQITSLVNSPCISGHEMIGSYNTLLFKDNSILGANTDYSGFIRAYLHKFGNRPPGQVLLCGAGGVGRAVAMGLVALGCQNISLFDIHRSQAESLAQLLHKKNVTAQVVTSQNLAASMVEADGLVNCTALGMYQTPGSAFDLALVRHQQWAFDAVYTPLETAFLSHCRKARIVCLSGFDLWIFQGLDAFQVFTGIELAASETLKAEVLVWLE